MKAQTSIGQFSDLDDFWPFYISQHLKPKTRLLHFAVPSLCLLLLAVAAVLRTPWLLMAALVGSYGLAWIGHFFIENNRPATFKYPLLSLRADFRMYRLMGLGRMKDEIFRLQAEIRRFR